VNSAKQPSESGQYGPSTLLADLKHTPLGSHAAEGFFVRLRVESCVLRGPDSQSGFPNAQPSTLNTRLFRELGLGRPRADGRSALRRYNPYDATHAMIPLIPKDLLLTTVQTVCYFCTAVGVLLTYMLSSRQ
jgi:hypothetical protein